MQNPSRLVQLLRSMLAGMTRKGIQLNDTAERVLKEAEGQGYRVSRVMSQGAEAILVEGSEGEKVHLWSSEDVIEYAKSKSWL
jgi:hypothetical protein